MGDEVDQLHEREYIKKHKKGNEVWKEMKQNKEFDVKNFGAAADGIHKDTKAIQEAIDVAAVEGGMVVLKPGVYLTGALFLKSGIRFHMEKGAVLLGSLEDEDYPILPSRVAGIEMSWPAGVLNIREAQDVSVTGEGIINGQGKKWWDRYWGEDRKGGMRKEYEKHGLRWAVDYDCFRPRNVIVYESRNVLLQDFSSCRSGFWNVHLCYCENVCVRGLCIGDNAGPSTDGIDVDSCRKVLIERCCISCNDDSICIKSGRDADGLRVNRICEDIEVRDCRLAAGSGITLGSETSGGICKIWIHDISFDGTSCGFRIKSARTRGGLISDILVENLSMKNVKNPFSWQLDWNPLYSYCRIPEEYEGEIPEYWIRMTEEVDRKRGMPRVQNVQVKNVVSVWEDRPDKDSCGFLIEGYEEAPFEQIYMENISLEAARFGKIQDAQDMIIKNVSLNINGTIDILSKKK